MNRTTFLSAFCGVAVGVVSVLLLGATVVTPSGRYIPCEVPNGYSAATLDSETGNITLWRPTGNNEWIAITLDYIRPDNSGIKTFSLNQIEADTNP